MSVAQAVTLAVESTVAPGVAPQVVVSELRRDVMTAIYLTGTIGTHSMT